MRFACIPPVVHFVWLGSSLPEDAVRNIGTFCRPGWAVQVHLDERLLWPAWRDAYNRCDGATNRFGDWVRMRSDLLRLSILRQRPGWYVDVDSVRDGHWPLGATPDWRILCAGDAVIGPANWMLGASGETAWNLIDDYIAGTRWFPDARLYGCLMLGATGTYRTVPTEGIWNPIQGVRA